MSSVIETVSGPGVDVERLRQEIERLDEQILAAIQRRSELARTVGQRQCTGSARVQQRYEMAVVGRFIELGPEGRTLGMTLLRLGRGRAKPSQSQKRVKYAPYCDQVAGTPERSNSQ